MMVTFIVCIVSVFKVLVGLGGLDDRPVGVMIMMLRTTRSRYPKRCVYRFSARAMINNSDRLQATVSKYSSFPELGTDNASVKWVKA
jgi:hypothetical protein